MKTESPSKLALAFYEVISETPASRVSVVTKNFVQYLADKRILKKTPQILVEFEKISKKKRGIKEIRITVARELNDKAVAHIEKAFGDKIESKIIVDEDLLGGFAVKSEDLIFDASVKTQLLNLKNKLLN